MAYFNRDSNNRSGRDNRGSGRGFGRSDSRPNSRPRQMFKTVCSSCKNECEVPFEPTSGKPVYCSSCFERMGVRSNDFPRNERINNFERPQRSERQEFRPQPAVSNTDNKKQLEELNVKLDKIISLLSSKLEDTSKVVTPVKKEQEKVVKSEEVKVVKKTAKPKVTKVKTASK